MVYSTGEGILNCKGSLASRFSTHPLRPCQTTCVSLRCFTVWDWSRPFTCYSGPAGETGCLCLKGVDSSWKELFTTWKGSTCYNFCSEEILQLHYESTFRVRVWSLPFFILVQWEQADDSDDDFFLPDISATTPTHVALAAAPVQPAVRRSTQHCHLPIDWVGRRWQVMVLRGGGVWWSNCTLWTNCILYSFL